MLLPLLECACIVSVIAFNRLAFLDQSERFLQINIDLFETLTNLGHVHIQVPDQLRRTHRVNVDVLRVIVKHVLDFQVELERFLHFLLDRAVIFGCTVNLCSNALMSFHHLALNFGRRR